MAHKKRAGRPPRHAGRSYPGHGPDRHASVVDRQRDSAGRQHLEYDIRDDDYSGDPQSDVPEEIVVDVAEAWQLLHDNPAEAARRLEPILERYPNVPRLYNFLRTAYASSGQQDKARDIAERNYRLHPTYLFAKLDCAADALARGEPQRVPEILGHKFDLKLMYPHRDAFHISEFVGLAGVVAEYFLAIDNVEYAIRYCDLLGEVAPDHPAVQALLDRVAILLVGEAIQSMARGASERPRRRRNAAGRKPWPPHGPHAA